MNPKKTKQTQKNVADDLNRMINEGLAGGWDGEPERNGRIDTPEIKKEDPPTVNGKRLS